MKKTMFFPKWTFVVAAMLAAQSISAQQVTIIDLGTLGGSFSSAKAINNFGQVVGESETASHENHAFFWSRELGMFALGTLGGTFSSAADINNGGQVTGNSATALAEHVAAQSGRPTSIVFVCTSK